MTGGSAINCGNVNQSYANVQNPIIDKSTDKKIVTQKTVKGDDTYSQTINQYGAYVKTLSEVNPKTTKGKIISEASHAISNCYGNCDNLAAEYIHGKRIYDGQRLITGVLDSGNEDGVQKYIKYENGRIVAAAAVKGNGSCMYFDVKNGKSATVTKNKGNIIALVENYKNPEENAIYVVSKQKVEKYSDPKLLENIKMKNNIVNFNCP